MKRDPIDKSFSSFLRLFLVHVIFLLGSICQVETALKLWVLRPEGLLSFDLEPSSREKMSGIRRSRRNVEEPEYGILPEKKRQRRMSTLSDLSTPSAPDWPELVSKARARVDQFSPTGSMRNSDKLVKTLHAFLEFLPQKGQLSIARDINLCGEDDAKVFNVFENLRTSLLIPSTS